MLGVGGFPSSWPLQDHKRPLSFRGLLSATDPEQTVEALEGGRCSQPPVTRKLRFNFQRCYSCLMGSFEGGAASVCGMGSVGIRLSGDSQAAPPLLTFAWGDFSEAVIQSAPPIRQSELRLRSGLSHSRCRKHEI